MQHELLKNKLNKEVISAAKNCNGNIFVDWYYLLISLKYIYGANIIKKYQPFLRNKFVYHHGRNRTNFQA